MSVNLHRENFLDRTIRQKKIVDFSLSAKNVRCNKKKIKKISDLALRCVKPWRDKKVRRRRQIFKSFKEVDTKL